MRRATFAVFEKLRNLTISIHALREEGDASTATSCRASARFLSTPSARRATLDLVTIGADDDISIHALREEGDAHSRWRCSPDPNFYPRPPRGGRPRSRCAERPVFCISIHALREEGDTSAAVSAVICSIFLSTPSARRATCWPCAAALLPRNFYPRPPRGGRRRSEQSRHVSAYFYPRPPRGGRPTVRLTIRPPSFYFYPRPPRGGRPPNMARSRRTGTISIHALREEGDIYVSDIPAGPADFYPRPPRGGRPSALPLITELKHFYPRPPRGGRPSKSRVISAAW